MIEGGNTKEALKLTEFLKDSTLNRIKDNTDLRIAVINKGKSRDTNIESGKSTNSQ